MPRLSLARCAAGLALALALGACDHTTDFDGPNLTDRFGDFALVAPLAASASAVDFSADESVTFTAEFNKQTAWVLEIVGQQSGAVKRIEGVSRSLDGSNARWRGGTTELPLFKDEPVTATLTFPNETTAEPTSAEVAVLGTRAYPGTVVAAFEGADNFTIGNFEFELDGAGISAEVPPGEGDGFFLFRGTDDVVPNFFVGLVDLRPPGGAEPFAVTTTVPEDLYLNFFLYGFNTPNTIAVVQVIADANGNGRFDDGADTVFPFGDIRPDFVGWRPFAKPMSELGLTQTQAANIVAVRVLLISDRNNQPNPPQPVEFGIDYVTFTAGGPLQL